MTKKEKNAPFIVDILITAASRANKQITPSDNDTKKDHIKY
jgi:hypothetical protein